MSSDPRRPRGESAVQPIPGRSRGRRARAGPERAGSPAAASRGQSASIRPHPRPTRSPDELHGGGRAASGEEERRAPSAVRRRRLSVRPRRAARARTRPRQCPLAARGTRRERRAGPGPARGGRGRGKWDGGKVRMGVGKEGGGEKEGWAWWEGDVDRSEGAWSVKACVRFHNYQFAFLKNKF